MTERDVVVGAHTLHTVDVGDVDGEPMLFLHGTGPGASGFASFAPMLEGLDSFRCLVPDLLGFGRSSHPHDVTDGPGSWLEIRVETVRAMLHALGIGRVHLVGHSYGCRVALELLKREPDRYGKVVLVAAGGTPVKASLQRLTGFYADPTEERMRELVLAQVARDIQELDAYMTQRFELARRPEVERSFTSAMGPGEPAPVNDQAVLATIHHEALAVHGRLDPTIHYSASLFLAEHLPHCDLHVFSGASHLLQLEEPDALARLVRGFVHARPTR